MAGNERQEVAVGKPLGHVWNEGSPPATMARPRRPPPPLCSREREVLSLQGKVLCWNGDALVTSVEQGPPGAVEEEGSLAPPDGLRSGLYGKSSFCCVRRWPNCQNRCEGGGATASGSPQGRFGLPRGAPVPRCCRCCRGGAARGCTAAIWHVTTLSQCQ